MPDPHIRMATPADAAAIAQVQVETWKATYIGLIPEPALAFFTDLQRREQQWTDALQRVERDPAMLARTFVALGPDQQIVVGFAIAGPARPDEGDPPEALPYTGEVHALYVRPEAQGLGIGRQLMIAAGEYLREIGLSGVIVWSLESNTGARGFYERLGGRLIARRERALAGALVTEVGYGWDEPG